MSVHLLIHFYGPCFEDMLGWMVIRNEFWGFKKNGIVSINSIIPVRLPL